MENHRLVTLANNIGNFFASEPDRSKGAKAIAEHIRNFWEPRMRRQIFVHVDAGGAGLDALVLEALKTHRPDLQPRT
jgi:formate dehydrogenase subunit delta